MDNDQKVLPASANKFNTKAQHCKEIKGLDGRTFRNFRLFFLQYPDFKGFIATQLSQLPIRRLLTSEFENLTLEIENLNYTRLGIKLLKYS